MSEISLQKRLDLSGWATVIQVDTSGSAVPRQWRNGQESVIALHPEQFSLVAEVAQDLLKTANEMRRVAKNILEDS